MSLTAAQLRAYYASGGPFGHALSSQYRYRTTNLLTGAATGDWLPIEVQSFSAVINGGGTLSGYLDLLATQPAQNRANLAALTPRKTVLWALQDGTPIWNGILLDWTPTTVLQPQLPVQAATLEFLLSKRLITTTLTYVNTDVLDIARGIIQYAFSKTPNGQVAGITYTSAKAGVTDSLMFDGSQNQDCLAALGTLVSTYGIEFSFRPYLDAAGNLRTSVDLGYPALGQPYPQSGLQYSFPGNLLDYEYPATGGSGANSLTGSAQSQSGTGAAYTGSAIDETDIANGYPLFEAAVSPTGVTFTSSTQVSVYCAGLLPSVTATQTAPLVVLGNGQQPALKVTQLGSYASAAFTSPLHPGGDDGEPGWTGTGRVVSWSCYPPNAQQAEYAQIQLGAVPFEGSAL